MRSPPYRLLIALCLVTGLSALPALADDESAGAVERRTREALAPRYLPAPVMPPPVLVERLTPDPAPIAAERQSVLVRMLDLRLRQLAGPRPPDPRRRITTGDLAVRVPISERLDLRPGMRFEYERHPIDDLWVGDPAPMLSVRLRF